MITLADVKAYIESHLTEAADEIRVKFAQVVAFIEGKQAADAAVAQAEVDRVAAEVADLTAKGYTVTAPTSVSTDAPVEAVPVAVEQIAIEVPEPVADAPAV